MLTWNFYLRRILPVGLFMALTLLCGNLVYLYLTVSFIQMLKARRSTCMLADECLWCNARSLSAASRLAQRAAPIPVAHSLTDGCKLGNLYGARRYATSQG